MAKAKGKVTKVGKTKATLGKGYRSTDKLGKMPTKSELAKVKVPKSAVDKAKALVKPGGGVNKKAIAEHKANMAKKYGNKMRAQSDVRRARASGTGPYYKVTPKTKANPVKKLRKPGNVRKLPSKPVPKTGMTPKVSTPRVPLKGKGRITTKAAKARAIVKKAQRIKPKPPTTGAKVAKKIKDTISVGYKPTATDKKIIKGTKKVARATGQAIKKGSNTALKAAKRIAKKTPGVISKIAKKTARYGKKGLKYGKKIAPKVGKGALKVGGKLLAAGAVADAGYEGWKMGKKIKRGVRGMHDKKIAGLEAQDKQNAIRRAHINKAKRAGTYKAPAGAPQSGTVRPGVGKKPAPTQSAKVSSPKVAGNQGNFGGSGSGQSESKKWQRGPGKMMVKTEAYKKAKKARRS